MATATAGLVDADAGGLVPFYDVPKACLYPLNLDIVFAPWYWLSERKTESKF